MQVLDVTNPNPQRTNLEPQCTLEGGATIHDRTDGLAKAVFLPEHADEEKKSVYRVLINDKQLSFLTVSSAGAMLNYGSVNEEILFYGSKSFLFKFKSKNQNNKYFKIIEEDSSSKTSIFVDLKKTRDGETDYVGYLYKPKEITADCAMRKIKNLKTDFPDFKATRAAYNRHGVAVFGWVGERPVLYWASPQEERVKEFDISSFDQFRDGGSLFAVSEKWVNFNYNQSDDSYYLNEERAAKLNL